MEFGWVVMRAMFERLGIIGPRDPEVAEVRAAALEVNAEARRVIHDSKERRTVLRLRAEHLARSPKRRRSTDRQSGVGI